MLDRNSFPLLVSVVILICETKVTKKNQCCKGVRETFLIRQNWLTLRL